MVLLGDQEGWRNAATLLLDQNFTENSNMRSALTDCYRINTKRWVSSRFQACSNTPNPHLPNGIARPSEVANKRFKSLTASEFDGDSGFCLGCRGAKRKEYQQTTFVSESIAVGKERPPTSKNNFPDSDCHGS